MEGKDLSSTSPIPPVDFPLELMRRGLLLVGKFKLASGKESPYYIDLRRLPSYPDLFNYVVEKVIESVRPLSFDYIVGVATGGVPLASFIACRLNMPMGYVRVEKKTYGTSREVEGEVKGRKVVVIDDVATTGGSIERAVLALREEGAEVVGAAVVVDRQEGAEKNLSRIGVKLVSAFKVREILEGLLSSRDLREEEKESIKAYIAQNLVE